MFIVCASGAVCNAFFVQHIFIFPLWFPRLFSVCIFIAHTHRFQLVEHQTISLRNVFGHPDSKIRQFFSSMLKASPDLEHALQKVFT